MQPGVVDIHATFHELGDSYTDQNELVGAEEEVLHRQVPDGTIKRGSLEHAYTLGTVRAGRRKLHSSCYALSARPFGGEHCLLSGFPFRLG